MSTVRSRPLQHSRRWPSLLSRSPVALLALAFSVPFWITGAAYTLRGWITALNWFFVWQNVPIQIVEPSSWERLAWITFFGLLYTWIEVKWIPHWSGRLTLAFVGLSVVFTAALITDWGSTFIGVRTVGPDTWPISIWLATTTWAAVIWTTVLSFGPEIVTFGSLIFVWQGLKKQGE